MSTGRFPSVNDSAPCWDFDVWTRRGLHCRQRPMYLPQRPGSELGRSRPHGGRRVGVRESPIFTSTTSGASSPVGYWNRPRICTTCGTFLVTPTSRRRAVTYGARRSDWSKRCNRWKRQQPSQMMSMNGSRGSLWAEVFGTIRTKCWTIHNGLLKRNCVTS